MLNLLEKSTYPIIVLEGPDGAGKTSLAKSFCEYTGAKYLHLTYRWKDKMHLYHYAAIRTAALMAQHQPVVVDRWWPSEIVYADAYRGGSKFTKYYFKLEHVARMLGAVYVVCLPHDRERYLEHYHVLKTKRDEMYNEGLERVYDGYEMLYDEFFSLREDVIRYDMFRYFNDNDVSREIVLRNVSQNILEFTEDYRSTI